MDVGTLFERIWMTGFMCLWILQMQQSTAGSSTLAGDDKDRRNAMVSIFN